MTFRYRQPTCGSCASAAKHGADLRCHHNPPTALGFPIVKRTWWCRQHQTKVVHVRGFEVKAR